MTGKRYLKYVQSYTGEISKLTGTQWIRKVLPDEGECVNISKPKHNFGLEVLDRLLLALWTRPDLLYIDERTRV
jgi:hypothetical protein